jgi:hypothetical protein
MNKTSGSTNPRNTRHGWGKKCLAILMIMITAGLMTDPSGIPLVKGQTFAGSLTLNPGENGLYTGVADTVNGFAYFGTATNPGIIVKVRLSDFTRVGALTLNSGEANPLSAVIDTANGFAYFGLSTQPAIIVKIRLSDFTRVGALTLSANECCPATAVIDSVSGFAYFGARVGLTGDIVKVRLSDFTRNASLTLNLGEDIPHSAVIDTVNGFAYFGTSTSPGIIVKVRLSDFTRVGALALDPSEADLFSAVIDTANGFAYFGARNVNAPCGACLGAIMKIRLSDFTLVGTLTLNTGENQVDSAVFDPTTGLAYFGLGSSAIVTVRLSDLTRLGALRPIIASFESALIDVADGSAYFGAITSPGTIVKLDIRHALTCTSPPSGLVSWWPGDGNAHDIVGTNDGTLLNAVTFAPGKVGQAFSLNGVNQYVNVGSSTTFDVLNFTIDAWVHVDPATNVGEKRVISRDDVLVAGSNRQLFDLKSSSPFASGGASGHAVFSILKAGALSDASAPAPLTAGWHHLAGVRFGSTIALYVDGVSVANTTTPITGTISPVAPLVLGQVSPAYNGEFFSGLIDEVEIFDRALSASEIQAVFNADSAGKCKPVANWMFDEGSGTTTYDRSGNGNNGTLVKGPTWVPGIIGNALGFNGSNYVQIPESQSLNITGNQFSITAWVNPRAQSFPFGDIVAKRCGVLTQYYVSWSWNSISKQVGFGTGLYNGTNVYFGASKYHPLDQWYQVATVYNGTRLRLFVDGNLEIDQPVFGNLVHLNVPVDIALASLGSFSNICPYSPVTYYFNGTIDEVRIYNTALSQSDIATLVPRKTTTTISCAPSLVFVNTATSCTATVADVSSGTVVTPSGSVSFTTNGTGTFSPAAICTLSGTGASTSCSVSYTPTARYIHAIGGSYGGDGSHAGSSASPPFAQGAIVNATIGGVAVPVDKLALLGLSIGIPTFILISAVALVVYVRRGRREDPTEELVTP